MFKSALLERELVKKMFGQHYMFKSALLNRQRRHLQSEVIRCRCDVSNVMTIILL